MPAAARPPSLRRGAETSRRLPGPRRRLPRPRSPSPRPRSRGGPRGLPRREGRGGALPRHPRPPPVPCRLGWFLCGYLLKAGLGAVSVEGVRRGQETTASGRRHLGLAERRAGGGRTPTAPHRTAAAPGPAETAGGFQHGLTLRPLSRAGGYVLPRQLRRFPPVPPERLGPGRARSAARRAVPPLPAARKRQHPRGQLQRRRCSSNITSVHRYEGNKVKTMKRFTTSRPFSSLECFPCYSASLVRSMCPDQRPAGIVATSCFII